MTRQQRLILFSLATGIGLMLIKFLAYFRTGSNAIFSDAAESIVNVVASAFAFYSIYLSAQPKDENHPYGHGKVEFFSVFVEGGLIFIAGSIILIKAVYAFLFPSEIAHVDQGLFLIFITSVVNFLVGWYLKMRGKALHSMTIEADGKHLQIDALSSVGLIAGLYVMKLTGWGWVDTVLSVVLGLYILFNGYKMLRKSISGLMDESDAEVLKKVVDVLNDERKPYWVDVHNLRVQRYGHELHIDSHLTLPRYYTLSKVHSILTEFEIILNKDLDRPTELFVHPDPCVAECCSYCKVEDCPIRFEELSQDIEWTGSLVSRNGKHFKQIGTKE